MLSLVLGMFYILNAPCSNTVHMMVLCNTHISEEVTYLKSVWLRFKFQEEMLQTNEIHSLAISELCPGHWSLATPQTYSTAKQEHSNVFYSWFIWSIQTSFLNSERRKKQWQKHTHWAIICMAYDKLLKGRIWGKNVGMFCYQ